MEKFPYLLVAENSVLGMIDCVIESLEKYGNPSSIYIVVPKHQMDEFRTTRCGAHEIIAEDDILPDWPLARVAEMLPHSPNRAGWYLQQFLKLNFGMAVNLPCYVVWDADTVMLERPVFRDGDKILMNPSREYHLHYFLTYKRLFGQKPTFSKSMISQYMLFESEIVKELTARIEKIHHKNWIEAVLYSLPGDSNSEFSEYETYANFLENNHPGTVILRKIKWFRYGNYIGSDTGIWCLNDIERKFSRYAYVAFERHHRNFLKKLAAQLLYAVKYSS